MAAFKKMVMALPFRHSGLSSFTAPDIKYEVMDCRVMYQKHARQAISEPTNGCATCEIKRPVKTAKVIKSLPPLNAPRHRIRTAKLLANKKPMFQMLQD